MEIPTGDEHASAYPHSEFICSTEESCAENGNLVGNLEKKLAVTQVVALL